MRWYDVDLEAGVWTVRQQLVALYGDQATPCPHCGQPHKGATFGPTKTKSGEDRVIDAPLGEMMRLTHEHRSRHPRHRQMSS